VKGLAKHVGVSLALLAGTAEADAGAAAKPEVTLTGYAEAFYQWNFARPHNNITNARGFDNRHNTFTLANVVLGTSWDKSNVLGTILFQAGHTPDSYYLAEPSTAAAGTAGASGPGLWKHVQEANVGYRFPNQLVVKAGLYPSPIGPETFAIRNNWNWSRSNLFFGLPYYHAGVTAAYPITPRWTLTLGLCNGWNNISDNNSAKSIMLQANFEHERMSAAFMYFGGVERRTGAAEGPGWRNLFDAFATIRATERLAFLAHANAGFEPTRFGASTWAAAALYARMRIVNPLYLSARIDGFIEHAAASAHGAAARIFWPGSWVTSGTATVTYKPQDAIAFTLEYRHDQAEAATYFDASAAASRRSQDTATLGITAGLDWSPSGERRTTAAWQSGR
jgi:hypothetical protein